MVNLNTGFFVQFKSQKTLVMQRWRIFMYYLLHDTLVVDSLATLANLYKVRIVPFFSSDPTAPSPVCAAAVWVVCLVSLRDNRSGAVSAAAWAAVAGEEPMEQDLGVCGASM